MGQLSDLLNQNSIERIEKPKSTIQFLPQAIKETLLGAIGFEPFRTEEPFVQQPLGKQVVQFGKEIPGATLELAKEFGKSAIGFLATPTVAIRDIIEKREPTEEIRIPFTDETAPLFANTYIRARESGLSPLMATVLTTSRAAGDVLIVGGGIQAAKAGVEAIGRIPVERPKIIELSRQDLIDITRGEKFAKQDPIKLEAFKQLEKEGINFIDVLKKSGKIDVKTGEPRTLFDVVREQARQIVKDERGFAKIPSKDKARFERDIAKRELSIPKPITTKPTKTIIRETTGQIKNDLNAFKTRIRDLARGAREGAKAERELQQLKGRLKQEEALGRKARQEELKRLRQRILDRERFIARGIKEGSLSTKRQIKAVQNDLIKIIDESGLELNDKAKFNKVIKNTQTPEQLERILPEVERRIKNLETASERRKLKLQINKEIKTTKVRKVAGKPVGKFTPEVQKGLDIIRNALKLTQDEATLKVAENLKKYQVDVPDEIVLENRILSSLNKDATVEELQDVLNTIVEIKNKGELTNELKKFNREADITRDKEFVIERVTGGKGIEKGKITFGGKPEKTKLALRSLGKRWILDWQGLLQTLEFNNKAGDVKLPSAFSTLEQDNKYKEFELDFTNDFENILIDSYGISKSGIHKKLISLSEEINLGKFKNADGIVGEMIMTKDEIIKRWMELQDETLIDSLIQGNKYTYEIIDAINKAMTPQDIVFAKQQFDLYRKQYDKINPIYSDIYGVDLPFNEFYSPIRRKGFNVDELQGMGEFLVDAQERVGLTTSSLISRVKNVLPLETQSSIHVLSRHMKETNYFIAYAKKIRQIRSVFGSTDVREAIKQEFGDGMNTAIGNTIDDLTTNGNRVARRYKPIDYFRKNFTIGALAIKPVIGIKQMVSTLAYLEKIGPIEFTEGVADFWKDPIKNSRILNEESSLIKTRGEQGNIERDIKAAQQDELFKRFGKKQGFINASMLNVRLGDKGAILTGSWALRRTRLKEGIPLKDIIKEYEEFSASTQQSADISRLSEVQRGGSFEQLFTMFKSSPRQYMQKELNAIRTLFQEGGFGKENIGRVTRILAIYHILLPVTFQYIANLGGWDEEDRKEYKRAAMLGSLNGIFIAGDVIDGILRTAMGLRVWDNEIAPFEIRNTINKGLRELDFDDITASDMKNALGEWSEAGNFIGIPVKQAKLFFGGAKDLMEGNIKRGLAQILGWSTFFVDNKKSNKKARFDRKKIKKARFKR